MSSKEKKDLKTCLEALLFRDSSGKIYNENNTNEMVLKIAGVFNVEIKDKISSKDKDIMIANFRKLTN